MIDQVIPAQRRPGIEKIINEIKLKYPRWPENRILDEAKNIWCERTKVNK